MVRRVTCSSDRVGVSCMELVGVVNVVFNELPRFDEILPIVLNVEPMLAAPLIDDGLYVGIGWNGLRDCVTGSGLNSTCVESENLPRFSNESIFAKAKLFRVSLFSQNSPTFDNGTLNAVGLLTHSARAFWKRRTCNGFDAISIKAIISKNSFSSASHSCWTSSPPKNVLINFQLLFKNCHFMDFLTYHFQAKYHNMLKDLHAVALDTTAARHRFVVSMCKPLQRKREREKTEIAFEIFF